MEYPKLESTKVTGMQLMLSFTVAALVASAVSTTNTIKPECQAECSNVSIPYPFGIGDGCFMPGYEIICNKTINGSNILYKPLIGNVEVINISLLPAEVRIYNYISYACFDASGSLVKSQSLNWRLKFGNSYRFSNTRNKFTAVGCDTLAYITGSDAQQYKSGCVSICENESSVINGSCSGMGCCQTSIPENLNYYAASFDLRFTHSSVYSFNPCSFAFLADEVGYQFKSSDIHVYNVYNENNGHMPMTLDWAIRNNNATCEEARRKNSANSYACLSDHSDCFDSTNGPGYICNCSAGYQGNPYLPGGCQDINECDFPDKYPCYGICTNTPGNYSCSCSAGTKGNALTEGGCRTPTKYPLWVKLLIGAISGILFVVIIGFWIYLGFEKGKLIRVKQRFFEQNGGFLLKQQIASHNRISFKIFTEQELETATNKFDQDSILGHGGQGTVYKGILEDKRVVAIKKARVFDERHNKEFAKETLILSQINHRNIVKILGCCLEVEIPMLVYEFVSNGTLFRYIHDKTQTFPISLDTRLRIAAESADALAYLHSSASPPIIHGDVKSANILLDENYTAKVSDFGASRLAPMDENQFATLVQGTCGYLDPEYLQTCQLTEKSDVYSFGVVLLELLTGKKALYFEGSNEERSLASNFLLALKQDKLLEILDNQVRIEGSLELFQEISELVRQCLSVCGEDRPTMKEVADALGRFRKFEQHPWVLQHNPEPEEIERLLGGSGNELPIDSSGYYIMEGRAVLNIEDGR